MRFHICSIFTVLILLAVNEPFAFAQTEQKAKVTTPDLSLYELSGKVKTCILASYETKEQADQESVANDSTAESLAGAVTLRFTPTGQFQEMDIEGESLTYHYNAAGKFVKGEIKDDPERNFTIKRNPQGQLIELNVKRLDGQVAENAYKINYIYTNGLCSDRKETYWEAQNQYKLAYTQSGQLASSTLENTSEGVKRTEKTVYTYLKFDAAGNWLQRRAVLTWTENESGSLRTGSEESIEQRLITYF
ncbi:MAG: hypothetical protein KBH23_04975 [Bacteroidaceae bacterium]|nr:hypothetical protein [Bacteroidaceae bacterium]